jgi:hypothetical protein
VRRLAGAPCLFAALFFAAPACAALSIVQFNYGTGSGTPTPSFVTSDPVPGDAIVVVVNCCVSASPPTLNTGASCLPYCQLANSFGAAYNGSMSVAVVRYAQAGDTKSNLPPAFSSGPGGNYSWAAYEVSGVTGSIAADLQTVGTVQFFDSAAARSISQIPQTSTTLAIYVGANSYGGTPTGPAGWTVDLASGSLSNIPAMGAWHISNGAAGTPQLGDFAGTSGVQLILQAAAPGYTYARSSSAQYYGFLDDSDAGILQTPPVTGDLVIANVFLSGTCTVNTTDWTQFATASSGSDDSYALYRYAQAGDTATLPEFCTDGQSLYTSYAAWEVAGVAGNWVADYQSSQSGYASASSITTSTGTTTQPNTLALDGVGLTTSSNPATSAISSGWTYYDSQGRGSDIIGTSQTFADKGSSVSATATYDTTYTIGYVQTLLGAAPSSTCQHTLAMMGAGC